MWVRKSPVEIRLERKSRELKYEVFLLVVVIFVFWWLYWFWGSFDSLLDTFYQDPEFVLSLLLLPYLIYFGYRDYVLHGNFFVDRPGKICLGCGIGLGYSDDGWRFKSYGRKKPKWYQFKACKTPEKCDIVYQCEVKWISDENNSLPDQ